VDVTVYGLKNSLAVKSALLDAYSSWKSPIQRFEDKDLKAWCWGKVKSFPLTLDEARQIYRRKWNMGIFEDTRFSVHPVKVENELTEKYADKIFEPAGSIVLSAVVKENVNSMFLPSIYQVSDIKVIKGPQATDILEIVSYEGLFSDIAEKGETILVKGKLEEVHDTRSKQKYQRVLVGSPEGKGKEYIKPI
jgi:hypothetical protein